MRLKQLNYKIAELESRIFIDRQLLNKFEIYDLPLWHFCTTLLDNHET